jgi:hypothetical protein
MGWEGELSHSLNRLRGVMQQLSHRS